MRTSLHQNVLLLIMVSMLWAPVAPLWAQNAADCDGPMKDLAGKKTPVELTTRRLTLQIVTTQNEIDLRRLVLNRKVMAMSGTESSEATIKRFLRIETSDPTERVQHIFGIFLKKKFIGIVTLIRINIKYKSDGSVTNETALGYCLFPKYWGKGYATEAAQAAVDFAFTKMQTSSIQAKVLKSNSASLLVLEKLGFELNPTKPTEAFFKLVLPRP